MARVFRIFTLYFLILIAYTNSALALDCYKCSGPKNIGMDCEILKDVQSIPCDQSCGVFVIQNPGTDILHRGCYPNDQCDMLKNQYANNPAVDVGSCRTCQSDNCNSANLVTVSLILSFLSLAILHL